MTLANDYCASREVRLRCACRASGERQAARAARARCAAPALRAAHRTYAATQRCIIHRAVVLRPRWCVLASPSSLCVLASSIAFAGAVMPRFGVQRLFRCRCAAPLALPLPRTPHRLPPPLAHAARRPRLRLRPRRPRPRRPWPAARARRRSGTRARCGSDIARRDGGRLLAPCMQPARRRAPAALCPPPRRASSRPAACARRRAPAAHCPPPPPRPRAGPRKAGELGAV